VRTPSAKPLFLTGVVPTSGVEAEESSFTFLCGGEKAIAKLPVFFRWLIVTRKLESMERKLILSVVVLAEQRTADHLNPLFNKTSRNQISLRVVQILKLHLVPASIKPIAIQ
jgi:hypothetical protein